MSDSTTAAPNPYPVRQRVRRDPAEEAAKLAEIMATYADENPTFLRHLLEGAPILPTNTPQEIAERLVGVFAFWPEANKIVPLYARGVEDCMTVEACRIFCRRYAKLSHDPVTGKLKRLNPFDILMNMKSLKIVSGLRLAPAQAGRDRYGREKRTCFVEGHLYVNTYRKPKFEAPDLSAVPVIDEFFVHLVPDPVERAYFLDAVAHKVQKPAVPGPTLLLAAENYGTGRGTFGRMITRVIGARYVARINPKQLTGEGSQSQYNAEWATALVIFCDEILAGNAPNRAALRDSLWTEIKLKADPAERDVSIIQKGIPAFTTTTHASLWLSTNHPGALPLDKGDRRIAVITNGVSLETGNPELYAKLKAFQPDGNFTPGFIAALAQMLHNRDVSRFDPYATPPEFAGKSRMIALAVHPVEHALLDVLDETGANHVKFGDLVERIGNKLRGGAPVHLSDEVKEALLRQRWVLIGRVEVDAKTRAKAVVYARDAAAEKTWWQTPSRERGGLLSPPPKSAVEQLADRMAGRR